MIDGFMPPVFLSASPDQEINFFYKSVILLIEHDDNGSLGLIINRQCKVKLKTVVELSNSEESLIGNLPVWSAGPVNLDSGFVLHNQKKAREEKEIVPGVVLSTHNNTLKRMINSYSKHNNLNCLYPYRLLVGHTGWSSGQLEQEIEAKLWYVSPFSENLLFNEHYDKIWLKTLQDSYSAYNRCIFKDINNDPYLH